MDYFQASLEAQGASGGEYHSLDNSTHLEFGLSDSITIGGKAIYGTYWLTNQLGAFTGTGFSEIEASAQYQFAGANRNAASVKLSAGKSAAHQPNVPRRLGEGGADIEIAGLYGRNLTSGPVKTFAAFETGYRKRLGDSADVIRSQVTFGVEPSKRLVFLIEGYSTLSVRNEKGAGADYDLVRIQPSILYRFNSRWAIQAGASEDVLSRNISPGRTYFLGLWSAF